MLKWLKKRYEEVREEKKIERALKKAEEEIEIKKRKQEIGRKLKLAGIALDDRLIDKYARKRLAAEKRRRKIEAMRKSLERLSFSNPIGSVGFFEEPERKRRKKKRREKSELPFDRWV